MGISYSTTQNETKAQSDVKYLGTKYPFGDDELWKLYKAFHSVRNSQEKTSFITDWAVECVVHLRSNETEEEYNTRFEDMKKERFMLMQVVENKILPEGFSQRLQETNFTISKDAYYLTQDVGNNDELVELEAFLTGLSNVDRRGGRYAIEVLFDYCSQENNVKPKSGSAFEAGNSKKVADCNEILDLAYRLSLAASFLEASKNDDDMHAWIPSEKTDQKAIKCLSHSLIEFIKRKRIRNSPYGTIEEDPNLDHGFVEKLDLQEWSEATAPVLASSLSAFMFHVFFPEKSFPQSRTTFSFPKLSQDSFFIKEVASPLLFSFACLSKSLGGSWYRLYSSSSDGMSYNRLQNALLGYSGPTIMIIEAIEGGMFGAFTGSAWKESKDFYGEADCFLYQLAPMTAVYRPSGNGTNYMYCNSEARSRGYDGQAHGIGFGGNVNGPRLFISETFENCIASTRDLTFEIGSLLPKTEGGVAQRYFNIDTLEVWGVGGDEIVRQALCARSKQREIADANIRKARKVDKAAFLEDFQSGLIESKVFVHRDQARGRADVDLEERVKKGYDYKK